MLTVNIENGICPSPWRLSRGVRKDELMEGPASSGKQQTFLLLCAAVGMKVCVGEDL